MNVWKLIAHHDHPATEVEYYRRENLIAVGWGNTGDLNQCSFRNADELKPIIDNAYPGGSTSNHVNGANSLWHLYKEMQDGDLVIVSANGKRVITMRVTEDYYFVGDEGPEHYEHRRRAKVVPISSNRLWQVVGGAAPGENAYAALVRCARPITEAEFAVLIG